MPCGNFLTHTVGQSSSSCHPMPHEILSGGVILGACESNRRGGKSAGPHLFLELPLALSVSLHLTGLQRDPGFQINHSKVFTNAQSQTQTGWHMATLFKCFSMCLWCQHLFHTYLHLKGGKKDVSVTFSWCQIWREEREEEKEWRGI